MPKSHKMVSRNRSSGLSDDEFFGLRHNRDRSPEDFIKYLCKASQVKNLESRRERSKDEFVQHCIDLYYKQGGRCMFSGKQMTYQKEQRSPTQISIDRIDNNRGYEIGNVRLLCHYVNNMMSDYGEGVFADFIDALAKNRDKWTCK